jgi:hypothetical protein
MLRKYEPALTCVYLPKCALIWGEKSIKNRIVIKFILMHRLSVSRVKLQFQSFECYERDVSVTVILASCYEHVLN